MKHLYTSILYLPVLLMAAGCTLDDIDTQMTDEEALASIRLECDALESYTVPAERGKTLSFRVSATTPWSIEVPSDAAWLTVSPLSSAVSSLSEDITVKAAPNEGFVNRTAVLTVSGKNTDKKYQVTVTQLRSGQLVVEPVAGEFAKTGGQLPFTIGSNNAWKVEAADPWLTFSQDSGESDGTPRTVTVQAVAAVNKAIVRKTTVTVASGELTASFEVTQQGETLEFEPLDSPSVDRKGGELLLAVNATLDWRVETDNPAFTAEKTADGKVKVSAPWNNRFAPRTARITLKPVADDLGEVSNSIEVTQAVNFKLEGNYEVLEDGAVKLSCGAKSRVTTLDNFRYVNLVLTLGDKNFGDKGELWCAVSAGGCNIYNQLSLGGNLRIRQDGTLPVAKQSTYKNTSLSNITKDKLNAMTEYRFEVLPDGKVDPSYSNVYWHYVNFWYNGVLNTSVNYRSVFADDPTAEGAYWFGFYNTTSDGTWYVVNTCDITPIAES